MTVRNDIHRLHVFPLNEAGKSQGYLMARRCPFFLVVVKGCSRKLFFACSGNGTGRSWNNRGSNGNYWSSSFNSARSARSLYFDSGGVYPQNSNYRYLGFAVRPVQHTLLNRHFFYGHHTATITLGFIPGFL